MRVLAYGDITDGGTTVFTSVTSIDGTTLTVSFSGLIRIDDPYRHLESYLEELSRILPTNTIRKIELDFQELSFCNSNGFYIIMDIAELVIGRYDCKIEVKRLEDDDWQQETLPILLNVVEPSIAKRTTFKEFADI